MHKNETTGRWSIIGTVYGAGYLCGIGKVKEFSGSTNGLWSSVPAQLDWVKKVMEEYSTECSDKEQEQGATKTKQKKAKQAN